METTNAEQEIDRKIKQTKQTNKICPHHIFFLLCRIIEFLLRNSGWFSPLQSALSSTDDIKSAVYSIIGKQSGTSYIDTSLIKICLKKKKTDRHRATQVFFSTLKPECIEVENYAILRSDFPFPRQVECKIIPTISRLFTAAVSNIVRKLF